MVFEHLFRVERILTLLLAGCFGWLGAMVSIRPPVSRTNGREPESDTPDPLMPPRPDLRLGRCRRVLIVGAGEAGRAIARELRQYRQPRYEVVGFVDDDPFRMSLSDGRILGTRDDLLDLVQKHRVDEVIIAYAPTWQQRLAESLIQGDQGKVDVKIVPTLYEAMIAKPKFWQINDIPVLSLNGHRTESSYRRYEIAKRILDVVVSCIILIVSLPILMLVALLIKLTSPGPMIYKQERVGKDGKPYTIYKFRTMVHEAEKDTGPMLSPKNDGRVTWIGRILRVSKLDEFPQFINVLKGEMSIVGPRPERPCFVEKFERHIPTYRERLKIKPGITGLAQVHGYYLTDVYTKLRYDLMYIYNPSIWWDLKIMALTVRAVIANHGK